MVIDKLAYASLYHGLGPRFAQALEWLSALEPDTMTPGERVEIDGDRIYAFRFDVDTLPPEECRLECHRNYADIQYLAAGLEGVGYALPDAPLKELTAYDAQGDIQFYTTQWDTITIRPGTFYIVWPEDLHAPRVALSTPGPVCRIVVKVKLN